jgi:uncharacterized short protein YbdD (DUF466 family)
VLKVNDQRGNPVEIGAVVAWRVRNTAKALFDVDDYENYVESKVKQRGGTSPTAIPMTIRKMGSNVNAHCATARIQSVRRCRKNFRNGCPEPVWWLKKHGSHIWLIHRKSPA